MAYPGDTSMVPESALRAEGGDAELAVLGRQGPNDFFNGLPQGLRVESRSVSKKLVRRSPRTAAARKERHGLGELASLGAAAVALGTLPLAGGWFVVALWLGRRPPALAARQAASA